MNLDDLNFTDLSDKGSVVTLFNPSNNKPIDIKITVRGTASKAYKDANREILKQVALETELFKSTEYRVIYLVSSLISGWENMDKGEKPYPYSLENSIILLTERNWIYKQLEAFIEDSTNFFLAE